MSKMSRLDIKLHNGDELTEAEQEVLSAHREGLINHVLRTRLGRRAVDKTPHTEKSKPAKVIRSKTEEVYGIRRWL